MDDKLSKKEKRELAKDKKREEKRKENTTKGAKKAIWLVVALAVVGWLGYKTYNFLVAPIPEVATTPIEVADSDWTEGPSNAQAVLIEYGDYQCPACGAYYPLVKQLTEDFSDSMLLVYRQFPLTQIHKNALPAAKAAEAAGMEGKFWEMHDMLFETQADWSEESNVEDIFASYAEEIGLNRDKFLENYASSEVQTKIDADIVSANALNINSTPTFFLDGERVQPRSYDEFKSLVEEALNN